MSGHFQGAWWLSAESLSMDMLNNISDFIYAKTGPGRAEFFYVFDVQYLGYLLTIFYLTNGWRCACRGA